MKKTILGAIAALLLGLSAPVAAAANKSGEEGTSSARAVRLPTVTDAWARATMPGQSVGAAYMKISSPTNVTLVKAETAAAKTVEVHGMDHHNGVMRMRVLGPLEVAAGTTVDLAPGGMHLMLLGLRKPLKAGETLQLKMTFASAGQAKTVLVVDLPIRSPGQ